MKKTFVIVNRKTNEAVMEVSNPKILAKLDLKKFYVISSGSYLADLSWRIKLGLYH